MKKLTRRQFITGGILAGAGLVLADAFWYERSFVNWKEFNLSNHSNPIKIIQISDLHLRNINNIHRAIAKRINEVNPDLIFFTGDTIDNHRHMDMLNEFLSLIKKDIKKIAILGNWEYWGELNLEHLKQMYGAYHCELLINESTKVNVKGREVSIAGMDDWVAGNPDFELVKKTLKPADLTIFLVHCPGYREVIEKQKGDLKIDFVLSGHTHGGQVNIFGFAPYKPKGSGKYLSGWYEESEPKLYVSKGVGTSIFPVRFNSRSEVAIFNV